MYSTGSTVVCFFEAPVFISTSGIELFESVEKQHYVYLYSMQLIDSLFLPTGSSLGSDTDGNNEVLPSRPHPGYPSNYHDMGGEVSDYIICCT